MYYGARRTYQGDAPSAKNVEPDREAATTASDTDGPTTSEPTSPTVWEGARRVINRLRRASGELRELYRRIDEQLGPYVTLNICTTE